MPHHALIEAQVRCRILLLLHCINSYAIIHPISLPYMQVNKYLFIVFFYILHSCMTKVFSQTNKIDILKTSLSHASVRAQQLDAALTLCGQAHSMNADTLYHYANMARQIAIAMNEKEKKILAESYVGVWLARKNLFDSALNLCNRDLRNISYTRERDAYANVLMQKTYLLMKSNRHKEALDETYHFLQQAETQNDTISQIFCKNIIGNVYRNMGQTDLALQWFYKADHTAGGDAWEEKKNEFGTYFLLGMMYNWKVDGDANQKDIVKDSLMSIYYLDRAIQDSRKFENLGILARALNVKAGAIGNREHLALEGGYVKEAKHIYEQLHDTLSILNSISPMCYYYIDEGHPEKGIKACEEGLEMIKRGNNYPTFDLYEALAQCYKAAGKYPQYANVLDTIIRLKDITYKKNSERDLAELNAKYEDEKKENTIIQQKLDIAAKKNSMYLALILSGFLLVSILFLYRYYYRKQKEQKQKEIIAVAAAEEAERRRISADLHDNIGAYAAAAASTIATIHPSDEQSKDILSLLKDNVQDMITQLNDSIWALNKKSVRLTGISDRFKLFIQKLEHAYPDITISLNEEIEQDRLLSPFQALHLFRIMQEALNNALRHSKCRTVNINLLSNGKLMQVSIVDDGIGMHNVNLNGNGINNLRARAKESGWNAEWLNNPEAGTSVILSTAPIEINTTN